jgi:hypothetical protein
MHALPAARHVVFDAVFESEWVDVGGLKSLLPLHVLDHVVVTYGFGLERHHACQPVQCLVDFLVSAVSFGWISRSSGCVIVFLVIKTIAPTQF